MLCIIIYNWLEHRSETCFSNMFKGIRFPTDDFITNFLSLVNLLSLNNTENPSTFDGVTGKRIVFPQVLQSP